MKQSYQASSNWIDSLYAVLWMSFSAENDSMSCWDAIFPSGKALDKWTMETISIDAFQILWSA